MNRVRRGFTLVEMMIALIITLMIVFAMVEAFSWVGETTTQGRAAIEIATQIRHARFRLEDDCSRCTVRLVPFENQKGREQGYFELIEGIGRDNRFDPTNPAVPLPVRFIDRTEATGYDACVFNDPNNLVAALYGSLFGDVDDVLAMTCHNDKEPYRGRYNGVIIESNDAEIIWWAELNDTAQGTIGEWDPGETFSIHRRVLLIRPDLNTNGWLAGVPGMTPDQFLVDNDISVRPYFDSTDTLQGIAANALGDLSLRHNRTAHDPLGNPQGLSAAGFLAPLDPTRLPAYGLADLYGEDVVLTNVLSFDFRVWDPNAPVCGFAPEGNETPEGIVPGDPNFNSVVGPGTIVGRGAFVDLGALGPIGDAVADPAAFSALVASSPGGVGNPHFLGNLDPRSFLLTAAAPFVPHNGNYIYDPWTSDYETDAFDQNGNGILNEGRNGLDDNGVNGVDDLGEHETLPPYNHPLQAIQVRIRVYEADTRQVRQMSQVVRFNK